MTALGPIEVFTARVPMNRPFAHAAKSRTTAQSVLVRCSFAGATGWGEGAPRSYVTGETLTSAVAALRRADPRALGRVLADADGFEAGVRALAGLDLPRTLGAPGGPAPAAAAALETALLDAWCRAHGRDAADALRVAAAGSGVLRDAPRVPVSALVLDSSRTPAELLGGMPPRALANLRHVKVKGLADPFATRRLVLAVRGFLDTATTTVSVDANGSWEPAVALRAAGLLADAVDWIEEPTRRRDWATLSRIQRETGCPVMLDESGATPADLDAAAGPGAASYVNVRVSKCGGPLRSLRMIERARALGLGYQLGVQVAEIGPLWAAGRLLAAWAEGPMAVESGRQDEWFGPGLTVPGYAIDRTRHLAPPLPGPGFGLTPSPTLIHTHLRTADPVPGQPTTHTDEQFSPETRT